MKDLFVPYKQALILKELGFNETCLTFYDLNKNIVKNDDWAHGIDMNSLPNSNWKFSCLAPLYQQVFKWFRDKHGLFPHIFSKEDKTFVWCIRWYVDSLQKDTPYEVSCTYEEAELASLKKLIEHVKNMMKEN